MKTSWQSLYDEIFACEKCELCRRIHNKVPGRLNQVQHAPRRRAGAGDIACILRNIRRV